MSNVLPLRQRHFNSWLKAYVEYAATGSESPIAMHFWAGVAAIAGALRRNVWLDMKKFEWVPNFYIILVAPPGVVAKSTTTSIAMNLLRAVPGVKFGPAIATWQALSQAFANSLEMVMMPDGLFHSMSALIFDSQEFGNLLNPQDREMIDFLITLWDGKRGTVEKITKTSGNDVIENPIINIIACTTPSWLEGNVPEHMIGGGFTSRCIFIYADQKRQLIPYPKFEVVPNFQLIQIKLVEDLRQIAKLRGEFILDQTAIAFGGEWYADHAKNPPKHLENARFEGYIARKQTHIHKLAMVLSAAESDGLVLKKEHLFESDKIISALERDMPRVFERIGTSFQSRGAASLVTVVRAHKAIERKKLFSILFREMSLRDFESALAAALEAKHVTCEQENGELIIKAA